MLAHITTGPRPARPDAIKIKKCGQSTYADILGIIKGAADLKDLQERVTLIRRTNTGELLLEMVKPNVVTPELQTLVSSTLAGSALRCRDSASVVPQGNSRYQRSGRNNNDGRGSTGDYFSYWSWNSDRCAYQTSDILQWHSSSQCPVAGSSNNKADEDTQAQSRMGQLPGPVT